MKNINIQLILDTWILVCQMGHFDPRIDCIILFLFMLDRGEQFCWDHPKFGNYHHRLLQTSSQCFLREYVSENGRLK